MKSAGKARNDGLYRHIRTSKEIIRNLLNDSSNTSVSFFIIDMFKKLRHCVIAACTQFSYLLIKPLVLDRLHGNSYEISAYKEIQ